jgi:hypothetical protein
LVETRPFAGLPGEVDTAKDAPERTGAPLYPERGNTVSGLGRNQSASSDALAAKVSRGDDANATEETTRSVRDRSIRPRGRSSLLRQAVRASSLRMYFLRETP